MSVLIKHMAMPKGCIYANDKDQTDYCPMLNHDDVPFCQYIENEPEIAIGIDERPAYCPLSDVPDTNAGDLISRQAAIDYCYQLINVEHQQVSDETSYGWERVNQTEAIMHHLEFMPSAQPEIIRCKECKYSEHWYKDKRRCFLWHEAGIDVFEDGYCNYAERRLQ